jgi:hypothetical protein
MEASFSSNSRSRPKIFEGPCTTKREEVNPHTFFFRFGFRLFIDLSRKLIANVFEVGHRDACVFQPFLGTLELIVRELQGTQ